VLVHLVRIYGRLRTPFPVAANSIVIALHSVTMHYDMHIVVDALCHVLAGSSYFGRLPYLLLYCATNVRSDLAGMHVSSAPTAQSTHA